MLGHLHRRVRRAMRNFFDEEQGGSGSTDAHSDDDSVPDAPRPVCRSLADEEGYCNILLDRPVDEGAEGAGAWEDSWPDVAPDETTWPDEGTRSYTISRALAERCTVASTFLEMAESESAAGHPDSVTLHPVPYVPSRGLEVLEEWARLEANSTNTNAANPSDASSSPPSAVPPSNPRSAWLPDFLASHASRLSAAAASADFLGCSAFLELFRDLQLLRVALADGEVLLRLRARARHRRATDMNRLMPLLSSLTPDDIRAHLPCLRAEAPTATTAATTTPGKPAAAAPDAAVAAAAGEATAAVDAAAGPSSCPSSPPGPRRRLVELPLFEALCVLLADSDLLTHTHCSVQEVRQRLWALGVTPALSARRDVQLTRAEGKYLYMALTVPRAPANRHYRTERLVVVAEAHDQGWSSYPEDRGTCRNSWTWGEVQVVRVGEGGAAVPVREGDPGRAYTNLHADVKWQVHRVELGPDAPVCVDLDAVLGEEEEVGEAGAGAGEGQGGQGQQGRGQGHQYAVQLLQCAAFPGWQHYMQCASITLELRPK